MSMKYLENPSSLLGDMLTRSLGRRNRAWMFRWKLGSSVRLNGLFHLLINGVLLEVK